MGRFVGSSICRERKEIEPDDSSSRRLVTVPGTANFDNSFDTARMPDDLNRGNVTLLNCNDPTGFGAPSPTNVYVPAALCAGRITLNGALRPPAARSCPGSDAARPYAINPSAPGT